MRQNGVVPTFYISYPFKSCICDCFQGVKTSERDSYNLNLPLKGNNNYSLSVSFFKRALISSETKFNLAKISTDKPPKSLKSGFHTMPASKIAYCGIFVSILI